MCFVHIKIIRIDPQSQKYIRFLRPIDFCELMKTLSTATWLETRQTLPVNIMIKCSEQCAYGTLFGLVL
jgi:hypothetical protein